MELLLKVPEGTPPRIGIKYTYEYQAVRAYEELVRTAGGSDLRAVVEVGGPSLQLTITSEYNGKATLYKELEFRLRDLQRLTNLAAPFIFVHVFPQNNQLLLAKPFRKPSFLSIIHLEVRGGRFRL